MRVIINDANILIDLVHLDLMNEFIQLEIELKTTDFVFEELNEDQKNLIEGFINSGNIELIITEEEEDFINITTILENSSGLSFVDCSVWHYANKLDGILLSGDGRLRKQATANGILVKGILYVFDQLLLKNLISFEYAIKKLEQLYEINPRLPIISKNERIASWSLCKNITA
jgi:predicted nucleic acid-binding protein